LGSVDKSRSTMDSPPEIITTVRQFVGWERSRPHNMRAVVLTLESFVDFLGSLSVVAVFVVRVS